MMYTAILFAHIGGAFATAIVALAACTAVVTRKDTLYRRAALWLGGASSFAVATGTLLAVISPAVSVRSICENILLYVLCVLFVEALLFSRMKHSAEQFPAVRALSPLAGAVMFTLGALVLGF